MVLRDRMRRLERDARGAVDYLELRDGTRYYFEPMTIHIAMFMEKMDGIRAIYVPDLSDGVLEPLVPEIRGALAKATSAKRYGSAERECAVIRNDGSVTVQRIALDGSASTRELEGEEAEEYREQVSNQPARF